MSPQLSHFPLDLRLLHLTLGTDSLPRKPIEVDFAEQRGV